MCLLWILFILRFWEFSQKTRNKHNAKPKYLQNFLVILRCIKPSVPNNVFNQFLVVFWRKKKYLPSTISSFMPLKYSSCFKTHPNLLLMFPLLTEILRGKECITAQFFKKLPFEGTKKSKSFSTCHLFKIITISLQMF